MDDANALLREARKFVDHVADEYAGNESIDLLARIDAHLAHPQSQDAAAPAQALTPAEADVMDAALQRSVQTIAQGRAAQAEQPVADYVLVIDESGDVAYGCSTAAVNGEHNARGFCHQHIKDAQADRLPNAHKWVVRSVFLAAPSPAPVAWMDEAGRLISDSDKQRLIREDSYSAGPRTRTAWDLFDRPLYLAAAPVAPAGWIEIDPENPPTLDKDWLLYCPNLGETNRARIELGPYGSSRGGWRHSWATHYMPPPAPPLPAAQEKP